MVEIFKANDFSWLGFNFGVPPLLWNPGAVLPPLVDDTEKTCSA